ncbi:MAG: YIP1 family protein [Acholeplasma sp.]|nr:YIP1 family protein [Acholeplasma sp.]
MMKIFSRKILVVLFALSLFIIGFSSKTYALTQDSAPYQTYAQGSEGLVLTQTAYEPIGGIVLNSAILDAEDIYIKDEYIYIADTGNKRMIKTDFDGDVKLEITGLTMPTGVHVDSSNNIYVADKGAKIVIKYDPNGLELKRFERPTVPLFGDDTPYVPIKIVSGPRDILYIVGEGSTDGLIQMNSSGDFLGFYGTNPTNKSFWQKLADLFGVTYAKTVPVSPHNLAIDSKGSVFTVSKTEDSQLKKFNISSQTIFDVSFTYTPVAIKINDFGNIYVISQEGIIFEFDSYGNLIFLFGQMDTGSEVLGRFVKPIDIEIDANNNLYILDKGSNSIQMLVRTEFASMIHQGLINYKNGIYDVEEWAQVLKMNSFFSLANSSIANSLYRAGNYDDALSYFKIANDRSGYSDAFWQVRYSWLQNNLTITFVVIILFLILKRSLKVADHKYHIYAPIRKNIEKVSNVKVVKELSYLKKIIRHPIDTVYSLKRENKSSFLTATIIYLSFFLLSLISGYTTGFLFNLNNVNDYGVLKDSVILVGIVLLFVVANYLISSLQSGEGWLRDIYIGTAYSLAPMLFGLIPLVLLSHVLTINESFIYQMLVLVMRFWTIILIVIVVKEVHNYSIKELIINIVLTIFTMLMIILMAFLIYILSVQMIDYFEGLIREVIIRG